jgi:hypothetical protein
MLVDTSLATTAMPIVAGARPNYFLLHTRATPPRNNPFPIRPACTQVKNASRRRSFQRTASKKGREIYPK